MKSKIKNEFGFTLIELMVAMTITIIIGAAMLASFRTGEKRKRIALASDTITNVVRSAQTYALAGKNTNNANQACRLPQFYFVGFDLSNNTRITLNAQNNCGTTDLIDTFKLPQNTQMRANGIVLDGVATSTFYLYFIPPFADIKAGVDGTTKASFTTTSITVEIVGDSATFKTVNIDGVAGKVGE
jgi:type II secretory pathway pseudopilin PulG